MDKIYSRPRIKVPIVKGIKRDTSKIKKAYFTLLILLISICTVYRILKAIDPIFEGLCLAKSQSIATEIANRKSGEVLAKYNYQDTVKIVKDETGKNNILKTDIVTLNQIVSDIALEIQNELNKIENQNVEIPMGALLGSQYFAATGPRMKIKIIPAGNIITDIKTEFKAAGINQTVYRIYLNIDCNVSILTSYKTINKTITNQILLVETVIVGGVPETYLQLEDNK